MTKPILLVRADGNQDDADALASVGLASVIDPYIQIQKAPDATQALELLEAIKATRSGHSSEDKGRSTWLIATSVNAIRCFEELVGAEALREAIAESSLRFAAVGQRTAQALIELGATDVVRPQIADSANLANLLVELAPGHAIIPQGLLAMKGLPAALQSAGWQMTQGVVYTTVTVPKAPDSVEAVLRGDFAAVIFRSPSAARAFLSFVPEPNLPLICAGFTTAKVIQDAQLTVASIPSNPTPAAVAQAVKSLLQGDR